MDDKNNNRTKLFNIRLTVEEFNSIKQHCVNFNNISHYIRCAISEFSNQDVKSRMDKIDKLIKLYNEYHNVLFHAAANLNQVVKRANELSLVGILDKDYINNTVMPVASNGVEVIASLRNEMQSIIKEVCRL